jgi:hypothetical protein
MSKASEKPFCRTIIPKGKGQAPPTLTFTVHALCHFHDGQMLSVVMAASLTAPTRMMEQASQQAKNE